MRHTPTLRLEPAVVTHVFLDGNLTRHPESHFLDIMIDDRSLRLIAGEPARDMVTELNRPSLPTVPEAVDRLLGLVGIPMGETAEPERTTTSRCSEPRTTA